MTTETKRTLADVRVRMAAARKRAQAFADKARGGPTWQRMAIPLPPAPATPMRAYRCKTCLKNDVPPEALSTCTACGRRVCEHDLKVQRVDGTGHCRSCAWARTRAFNDAFGLSRSGDEPKPPAEVPAT